MKRISIALALVLSACGGGAPTAQAPAGAVSVTSGGGSSTQMINALRAQKGLTPVRYSKTLEQAAQVHANDMVNASFFSHTGSDGSSVGDRTKRVGYKWCFVAENIAYGQPNVGAVMQTWADSPNHYANMTNRKAREFALARAPNNRWVMVLAQPC